MGLLPAERRATAGVASVLALRVLGVSLVLPVIALHAATLTGDPLLVGLAVGAYGVTMAVLQVPLGALSDRVGRKPVLAVGLALFAAGSAVCALAPSAAWLVVGRLVQGAGATSSAATALVADVVPTERRGTAMALVGAPIGAAFAGGLVLGPILADLVGVRGVFAAVALAALLAEAVLLTVPEPRRAAPAPRLTLARAAGDPQLVRVHVAGFANNFALTSFFVVLQLAAARAAGLPPSDLWKVTVPMVLLSGFGMLAAGRAADRGHLRAAAGSSAAALGVGAALAAAVPGLVPLLAGGVLFFLGFSALEALLPTLATGLAGEGRRGLAVGVFNTAQFLGTAAGGVVGAALSGRPELYAGVALAAGGLAVLALATVRDPRARVEVGEAVARDAV